MGDVERGDGAVGIDCERVALVGGACGQQAQDDGAVCVRGAPQPYLLAQQQRPAPRWPQSNKTCVLRLYSNMHVSVLRPAVPCMLAPARDTADQPKGGCQNLTCNRLI